ncbi:MAG: hypothetical protein WC979_05090 [Candidatus Pacearchaeota archaeon]|jgi:hypothetical protein
MEDKSSLKKFPANFSLEDFARVYVEEAISAARLNPDCDRFYNQIYQQVSARVGVSPDAVAYLSHPFHWEFFCYSNGDAIFNYNQVNQRPSSEASVGSSSKISLVKEPNSQEIANLVNSVLNGSLSSRVKPSTLYFKLSKEDVSDFNSSTVNERRRFFESRIKKVGIAS